MRRLIFLILIVFISHVDGKTKALSNGALSNKTKVTIYADADYKPYSFEQDNVTQGIYVEVLRAIVEKMPDYQVKIVPMPWHRAKNALKKGEVFAIIPPYKLDTEEQYMTYSHPIIEEQVVVYCKPDALPQLSAIWPVDFYGKTIARNNGFSIGGSAFNSAIKNNDINVFNVSGNQEGVLSVISSVADCYVNDHLSILWELGRLYEKYDISENALVWAAFVSSEWGHLAVSKFDKHYPFKNDFLTQFNQHLDELKQQKKIDEIINSFVEKNSY